ncbi:hypothetical protein E4T56_gene14219, partial [Termitomyces sp. T112]
MGENYAKLRIPAKARHRKADIRAGNAAGGGSASFRYRTGGAGRFGLCAALFDDGSAAGMAGRPAGADAGDRGLAGGVERLYRALRRGVGFLGDVRVPPWRGRGRGGRGGAVLCADFRHFPPASAGAGAGGLFAGHSAGIGGGDPAGRLCRGGGELARGLSGGRAGGAGVHAAVRPAGARSAQGARREGPRHARGAEHPCGQAQFLAAGLWGGVLFDDGLWAGLLAALADAALLRAGAGGDLAILWPAAADRRDGGGDGGRRLCRLAGRAQPGGLWLAAGGLLSDGRAAVCRRALFWFGADHLLAVPPAAGAGLSLARPGADGGAASRARPDARDGFGQFPPDQQPDRGGAGVAHHR